MTTTTPFLPKYTFDQLSEQVCLRLSCIGNVLKTSDMWEGIPELCQQIEDEPRAVNSVIAEVKTKSKVIIQNPIVRESHMILARVYILLYYRHRDDAIYKAIVFPELKRYMGIYANEKQQMELIHTHTDKIIELDKLVEEAKKKDVKPVFKFEGFPGDTRDHLFIEYNEEELFRSMSPVIKKLCKDYGTHLDEPEVWYNAKKVVHTLRDIKRPELMIQRAAEALCIGQIYEGYKGAQIILLCVYMMVRESPNHAHFDNFIAQIESYALNADTDMHVLKNVRPIKNWLDENLPLDDYDYIGDSARKQDAFTAEDMERALADYKSRIQTLEEEKKAKMAENDDLLKKVQELEKQATNNQSDDDEEQAEPPLGVLHNKVKFELFLRFLEQCGVNINRTNKTDIGDLWHAFTEKSADDCRKYCSNRNYINNHTKKEIEELNKRLSYLGITAIEL